MAVPRKRKKLAEKSKSPAKKIRASSQKPKQTSKKHTAVKAPSKKIDNAFKIMTHIESKKKKSIKTPRVSAQPVEKKEPSLPKSSSDRMGFRFQISLDALMPNKARRFSETRKQPVKESTVIDIDLTIPFLWDLPIIGGITQKFFKNFKTIKL
jgi:hypothetical protein